MDSSLLTFLLTPESYPHPATSIRHLETHISHVFLTGDYAYKLKKEVDYGFLDFSTLEKRGLFCKREIELNRRYAPDLYIGVVAVVLAEDQYELIPQEQLTPSHHLVEYAVKMREFEPEHLFTELLEHNRLTDDLIRSLTDHIVTFQKQAEAAPGHGTAEEVRHWCQENFEQCQKNLPDNVPNSLPAEAAALTEETLTKHFPLLESRELTSIKLLHGDLHLKNICLFRGKPTLFDGIEFNDSYASCDVWCDIAFLLMDLIYRGHPDLASVVMNEYLELSDDYEGLELLNLFISYRAGVRAKVSCLQLADIRNSQGTQQLRESALKHLLLSRDTLRLHPRLLLACGGLSGSGKSTLATLLARSLGAVHIRSDVVRKHLLGIPLTEKAPPEAYTEENKAKTYVGMLARATQALESGRPILLDSVFGDRELRTAVQAFATENDLNFCGLWCSVPESIARARIQNRLQDASDADVMVYQKQLQAITAPEDWIQQDTQDAPDKVCEQALRQLEARSLISARSSEPADVDSGALSNLISRNWCL